MTMGFNRSYADILEEWRQILDGTEDQPELIDPARRAELAELLVQARGLFVLQAQHQAAKQVASRALNEVVTRGEDLARDAKAQLRGNLGTRSEMLVRFMMKPLRIGGRRSRRAPSSAEAAAPGEEVAGRQVAPLEGEEASQQG
jgi:hypothetical protein